RIDDLKKMSGRAKEAPVRDEVTEFELEETEADVETAPAALDDAFEIEYWPVSQEWAPPPPAPPEEIVPEEHQEEQTFEFVEEPSASDATEAAAAEEFVEELVLEDGLYIELLDDDEFYSGKRYTLRALISKRTAGDEKPLANVAVSVKILGTTFRPLI